MAIYFIFWNKKLGFIKNLKKHMNLMMFLKVDMVFYEVYFLAYPNVKIMLSVKFTSI